MNRKRITLVALPAVVLGLAGAAAATPGRAAHTAASPAAQVREAERTLLRAVVDADTQTAGTLLARDFQLVDVTGTPETRAQYLSTIGGQVDFVKLDPIAPIRVRVDGSSAVARVKLHFKVVAGPQTLEHDGWTTDVFERHNGGWQVVWSQSTAIPNDIGLFAQSLAPPS
jgi:uncharacterized protein DUF4440